MPIQRSPPLKRSEKVQNTLMSNLYYDCCISICYFLRPDFLFALRRCFVIIATVSDRRHTGSRLANISVFQAV